VKGSLDGINVLDFGLGGAGPWAAVLLGYLGANVIKVERPDGDYQQRQLPLQNGFSLGYTDWNMSKKAFQLDLKSSSGQAAMRPIVQETDVVMGNLRPGKMGNIGMSYEAVAQVNPLIVHATCPGWGEEGPLADLPFHDGQSQAFCGFASLNGDAGGKPELFRHSYPLDLVTSIFFSSTVLLGLIARERTGEGQRVRSSHLASSFNGLISRIPEYWATGRVPLPMGSASVSTAPHQAFLCQDKRYMAVGVETPEQWEGLCQALKQEDLKDDPRFATNGDRVARREELAGILQETFLAKPSRWWAIQLDKNGVPYGYLYDFETLRNHAQVLENRFIELVDIPHQGKVYMGGIPWRFSKTPASMYAAPRPGQHTEEILAQGFKAFGDGARSDKTGNGSAPGKSVEGQPPLTGLRVVEATQGLCGPYAGLLLAEAGAQVIKVEPPAGDHARQFAPGLGSAESAAFVMLNRNKEGVILDTGTEKGRQELLELLKEADIFIEDWGPGKAEELGLGYETLEKLNPKLVYCAISPFGEKGPFRQRPGSELVVQMMAEQWASLGDVGEPPLRVGADIANVSTALMSFLGVLAALFHRLRSGTGQRVAMSKLGTLLTMRQVVWSAIGSPDEWEGAFTNPYTQPRHHGLQIGDRRYYVRPDTKTNMPEFLAEMGRRYGLPHDIASMEAKLRHLSLEDILGDAFFREEPYEQVAEFLAKHDFTVIPINDLRDALEHPQTATLDLVDILEQPTLGAVNVLRPPWKGPWERPAPSPAPMP